MMLDELILRVYADFLEMPGMRLTFHQAQRLWGVDAETCTRVVNALVQRALLRVTDGTVSLAKVSP